MYINMLGLYILTIILTIIAIILAFKDNSKIDKMNDNEIKHEFLKRYFAGRYKNE